MRDRGSTPALATVGQSRMASSRCGTDFSMSIPRVRPACVAAVLRPRMTTLALTLSTVSACTLAPRVHGDVATAVSQSHAARLPVPGAPAGVTAFVNVNVLPMDTERVLARQTVLVKDGWITALGPSHRVNVPAGAAQIDGGGKYLTPGFGDCYLNSLGPQVTSQTEDTTLILERKLLEWLSMGVTTVRALEWSSDIGPSVLKLRAQAAAGELLSPKIYASGRLWNRLEQPDPKVGSRRAITRPDEVTAQVAAYKTAGYDFITVRDEIDVATPQGQAVWDSLVAAARRAGLPITGYVLASPPADGWFLQHLKDFRSIDGLVAYTPHLLLDEPDDSPRVAAKMAELMAAVKRAGVWSCPTIEMYVDAFSAKGLEQVSPPPGISISSWTVLKRQALRQRALVKGLQDAGTGLLAGTVGMVGTYIYYDLVSLVAAGLTPYQALVMATRNMAEYFGTLDETGTVAVGKRADLLLFDRNPLENLRRLGLLKIDDVREQARPAGVMLGGRWLPRAELDRHVAELEHRKQASKDKAD
jgi:imidazolonepropionase-like amidohydrolase